MLKSIKVKKDIVDDTTDTPCDFVSYETTRCVHLDAIKSCTAILENRLQQDDMVANVKTAVSSIEATHADVFIGELDKYGALTLLRLSRSELSGVPDDAKLDMIEASCEGFVSGVWDAIVAVCKAIAKAVMGTLEFVARLFGFKVGGSGGGGGGGGSSSVSNSPKGKKFKEDSKKLKTVVKNQKVSTKDSVKRTFEATRNNTPPPPPQDNTDKKVMKQIGEEYFDTVLDFDNYISKKIEGLKFTKDTAKLYLYRYTAALSAHLDVRYRDGLPPSNILPRQLLFTKRLTKITNVLVAIDSQFEKVVKNIPTVGDDLDDLLAKLTEKVLPDIHDMLNAGKDFKSEWPLMKQLYYYFKGNAAIESRNVILGSYGPTTNQVTTGYLEDSDEVAEVYNKLGDVCVSIQSKTAVFTTDPDKYKAATLGIFQEAVNVSGRVSKVAAALTNLQLYFATTWNGDIPKFAKYMKDVEMLNDIITA